MQVIVYPVKPEKGNPGVPPNVVSPWQVGGKPEGVNVTVIKPKPGIAGIGMGHVGDEISAYIGEIMDMPAPLSYANAEKVIFCASVIVEPHGGLNPLTTSTIGGVRSTVNEQCWL